LIPVAEQRSSCVIPLALRCDITAFASRAIDTLLTSNPPKPKFQHLELYQQHRVQSTPKNKGKMMLSATFKDKNMGFHKENPLTTIINQTL
jgi:hypothetical protein